MPGPRGRLTIGCGGVQPPVLTAVEGGGVKLLCGTVTVPCSTQERAYRYHIDALGRRSLSTHESPMKSFRRPPVGHIRRTWNRRAWGTVGRASEIRQFEVDDDAPVRGSAHEPPSGQAQTRYGSHVLADLRSRAFSMLFSTTSATKISRGGSYSLKHNRGGTVSSAQICGRISSRSVLGG